MSSAVEPKEKHAKPAPACVAPAQVKEPANATEANAERINELRADLSHATANYEAKSKSGIPTLESFIGEPPGLGTRKTLTPKPKR